MIYRISANYERLIKFRKQTSWKSCLGFEAILGLDRSINLLHPDSHTLFSRKSFPPGISIKDRMLLVNPGNKFQFCFPEIDCFHHWEFSFFYINCVISLFIFHTRKWALIVAWNCQISTFNIFRTSPLLFLSIIFPSPHHNSKLSLIVLNKFP